jgi:hypothetical protein
MSTATCQGPSRVELELLMRAAARAASPQEHGREQARRTQGKMVRGLTAVATAVAAYDLSLLLGEA